MCLFPRKNLNRRNRHQIAEYECGNCPECLSKRSRLWALRATMEAKYNVGMMITLTYDQYERDANGRIIGEKPADTRELSKRDCQLFIKRLRKHYSDRKLRYILTAEHGTRTGRSHYHAVIFGVVFEDIVPYKKTKRGNQIYLSQTLKTLWGKGICTVDCVNISTAVARYCTKYCAKSSGVDDTFMLFSRGIGDRALEERLYRTERIQETTHTFTVPHQKYIVEGSAYAIPRTVLKTTLNASVRCTDTLVMLRCDPSKIVKNAKPMLTPVMLTSQRISRKFPLVLSPIGKPCMTMPLRV